MKEAIFKTEENWSPLFLRTILGIVVFAHGAQKLFGWFGGYGFNGTMNFFTDTMALPWFLGFLVILFESVGAIVLMVGFATRIMAISYLILALGIVFTSHVQNGFFMNWYGNKPGEGYEFFLLWIAMAFSLILAGGGKYSVDKILSEKLL